MMTSVSGISICSFVFQISCHFAMNRKFPSVSHDAGTQSGNETQYLFSKADVRDSETDLFSRPVLGKLVFPLSFKLL